MTRKTHMSAFALATAMLGMAAASQAVVITYDNSTTPAAASTSSTDLTRTYGDSLNMIQGGLLDTLALTLFNSSSGNTGAILTGVMTVNIYDNTTPYASGAVTAQPLLGSFTGNVNFGTSGLGAGFYTWVGFTGLSSLNINLTQNVLITQSFAQTTGSSLRYGAVLMNNPTIGTSPATYYLKGVSTPEGLYTGSTGQLGYQVGVVPEPASMTALGLGVAAMIRRRRNRK